jgi:hypothetical protein
MTQPPSAIWMFPYIEACRVAGVLELASGDILELTWEGSSERPRLAKPGSGMSRCIVLRVQHGWHGYASKVVVAPMIERAAA